MDNEKENGSPDTVLVLLEHFLRNELDSPKASTTEVEGEVEVGGEKLSRLASRWAEFLDIFRGKSKRCIAKDPLDSLRFPKRCCSARESGMETPMDDASLNFKPQFKNFSFSELQYATNYFRQENLIGKGGYAEVYVGCFPDYNNVAIKRFMKGQQDEKTMDFLSELGIMAHVDHPNTAKLIGYGVEGGLYLVLELSYHGSLANRLHMSEETLNWKNRYKVAVGTAKGLQYLHEGGQRRIVHRDIKSSNILLTEDFEPQICDFGLAKWLPERWTHLSISKFEGTFGYLAPEYLMHGIVDEKTDVYAYGVLILELITGRRAHDYSQQSLVVWAKPLMKKNSIIELVDPALCNRYNSLQLNLMVVAASLCVEQSPIRRPQISQVLQLLKGDRSSLEVIRTCRKSSNWKRYYEDMFSIKRTQSVTED